MRILKANGNAYLVKRVFPISKIKDEELLSEIKGFWGADSIIKNKRSNQLFLTEKIRDVEFEDIEPKTTAIVKLSD